MRKWIIISLLVSVPICAQAGKKEGAKGTTEAVTKEQFLEQRKAMAEKKNKEFNQEKSEARFDKLDADGDGKLTAEERAAGRKGKGQKQPDQ